MLDVRTEIHEHYFQEKFDSAKALSQVDQIEYVVAINKLLGRIREWLQQEAF